jgi:hypothetical protein
VTVEEALAARATAHTGLNALLAGRFYTDLGPQSGLLAPYVVIFMISHMIPEAMGVPATPWKYRYQFDLYASSVSGRASLFDQIMAAFHRWRDPVASQIDDILFENATDGEKEGVVLPGSAVQLFVKRVDFMIHYQP